MESVRNYKISEVDELRFIYYEISRGKAFVKELGIYLKHFSEEDSYLLLRKKIELFDFYLSEGVPHESELLKNAIENEEWSEEKENKILELKYRISDNEKNIHNIIVQQQGFIQRMIDNAKKELNEILDDRKGILGRSIEDLIDDDIEDYLCFLSVFKDEKCETHYSESYDEFQKLDNSEIYKLNYYLNRAHKKYSEENIKKIACLPFFLNKFSYAKDNIESFLGKPFNYLTNYQINLFSFGTRNLNTLTHAKGSPPDISLEAKVSDVSHWFDIQHSILISKQNESDS